MTLDGGGGGLSAVVSDEILLLMTLLEGRCDQPQSVTLRLLELAGLS